MKEGEGREGWLGSKEKKGKRLRRTGLVGMGREGNMVRKGMGEGKEGG